ncbi:MAG: hypothetical protein GY845_36815 [Planctomycetes bacterium]|nr:hypothetical protein [Planctomycetota bacterium]
MGKALVKELGLDPGVDTLARWMAHYIAEQMAIAENATGDDKIEAERRCFETILKLWQHRSSLPNGQRPFESFEPVFRALERLDPENPTPYFYPNLNLRSSESDDSDEEPDEVQRWLDVAQRIDQAARVWLEHVFHQAALDATDEKTITWLENAVGLPAGGDISTIIRLVYTESEDESEDIAERERRAKEERLKSRIKQLDAFVDFSQDLRAAFVAELETMTQSDSSADVVDTD